MAEVWDWKILCWGCSVHCWIFGGILGLHPIGANSTCCENQKCLQTLPNAPLPGAILPSTLETPATGFKEIIDIWKGDIQVDLPMKDQNAYFPIISYLKNILADPIHCLASPNYVVDSSTDLWQGRILSQPQERLLAMRIPFPFAHFSVLDWDIKGGKCLRRPPLTGLKIVIIINKILSKRKKRSFCHICLFPH